MAEQAGKNLNRIKFPEREKINIKKASEPLANQLDYTDADIRDLTPGQSYKEHLSLLARIQSTEQLTAFTARLQRTYGNAYVQRLFSSHPLQSEPKVKKMERSDTKRSIKAASLSVKGANPQQQEEEEDEELQTANLKKLPLANSESLEARIKKARSSGQPLPHSLRVIFEPQFGKSINQVRIHANEESDSLARSLKAAAFTSGKDIFFRKKFYNPDTLPGKNLIARELSHVVRQAKQAQRNRTGPGTEIRAGIPLSITPVTMVQQGRTGRAVIWPGVKTSPVHINSKPLLQVVPHIFVNGGKTGTAAVWWGGGGGGGGQGNQPVGDVTQVQPRIKTSRSGILGLYGRPVAWVERGTGTATVTRSYVGVLVGANGTYYITARAAAQIDRHEEDHVNSSRRHHDTYIAPLEERVAEHTGSANALEAGDTREAARAALENYIDWTASINSFVAADNADNYPMGAVDQADMADPNTKFDYGPREVDGVNYAHYVDIPPGPPAEEEAETGEEVSELEEGEEWEEEGVSQE